jgi:hypothetical protein
MSAQEQALDSNLKPTDKTTDSVPNMSNVAASQWQDGGAWRSAMSAMQLPNTSSEQLPNFTIDNTGSGNVTVNFNGSVCRSGANPGQDLNSFPGLSANQQGDFSAGLKQVETDMATLKQDLASFSSLFNGCGGDQNAANPGTTGSDVSATNPASTGSDVTATNPATTGSDITATNPATTGSDISATNPATTGSDITATNPATTGSDITATNPATTGSDVTAPGGTVVATNPANTSGLYVQGNQIMDNGKPFIMTGINDTTSTEHNVLTSSMPQIAASGANTVRLMGQASDLTGGPNNAFNQEVQAALNAGLKVDLSWNSDTAIYGQTGGVLSSSDVAEGAQALKAAAAQWGNNSNVIYNVVNEQGASGDANNPQVLANTVALEQAVVQGAQSANSSAQPIIAVDDTEWGQGAYDPNYQSASFLYNNAAALEQAGNGNVIGAVHNYDAGSSYDNQGIQAIQSQGMPVIAEEVGYNQHSFDISSQVLPTTGEPVGGLVWLDGTDPNTGSFYNNILADQNLAPQVTAFWQKVDGEVASATPATSS